METLLFLRQYIALLKGYYYDLLKSHIIKVFFRSYMDDAPLIIKPNDTSVKI